MFSGMWERSISFLGWVQGLGLGSELILEFKQLSSLFTENV